MLTCLRNFEMITSQGFQKCPATSQNDNPYLHPGGSPPTTGLLVSDGTKSSHSYIIPTCRKSSCPIPIETLNLHLQHILAISSNKLPLLRLCCSYPAPLELPPYPEPLLSPAGTKWFCSSQGSCAGIWTLGLSELQD